MQFSVRITEYQKKIMLNICDADLLGKKIIQDELTIHISQSYYGERFVEREEDEDWMDPPTWDWMGKRDAPLAEPTLTDNFALVHAIEGWSFHLDMAMRDETIRRDELTPVTSKPPQINHHK